MSLIALIRAMRPHQYAKNLLIFLPLILGHWFNSSHLLLSVVLGFVSFCLMASAVYIFNDWLDVESDRQHPRKCHRPFASAALSVPLGLTVALIVAVVSLLLGFHVGQHFFVVLIVYAVLTTAYSLYLKRLVLVDVFVLAVLYSLRIFAGMAILAVAYSQWLIIFSFFFFTSLAFVKRFVELKDASDNQTNLAAGRGYSPENWLLIKMFGICSAFVSALVFALYLSSDRALQLYQHPEWMYAICPLLLYWLTRVWWLASEGNLHDDPVVFAIKDKVSYLVLVLIVLVGVLASWW